MAVSTLSPNSLQAQRAATPTSPAFGASTPAHFLEEGMMIVDPLTRKVIVPYEHIYETRAFQRGSVPSLCMLFQNNRCRQGAMCYQVHADPTVVHQLRSRMPQRATCCQAHANKLEVECVAEATIAVPEISWNEGQIPVDRFAITTGLKRTVDGTEHATICRAGNLCRFGEECRYLHVCRELETLVQGHYSPPSYPTTPLHHPNSYQDLSLVENSPNTLGASMASLGNSFTSLPTTPLQCAQPAPEIPRGDGPWKHEPYSWRCMALTAVEA